MSQERLLKYLATLSADQRASELRREIDYFLGLETAWNTQTNAEVRRLTERMMDSSLERQEVLRK